MIELTTERPQLEKNIQKTSSFLNGAKKMVNALE